MYSNNTLYKDKTDNILIININKNNIANNML